MSTSAFHRFAIVLFAAACCAVVAINVAILLGEHEAGGQIAEIRQHLAPEKRANAGRSNESRQKTIAALRALKPKAEETARNLASLQGASPTVLIARTRERLRQLTDGISSLTQRLADLSLIPDRPETESAIEPRIVYARHDLLDEFLELAGPPNTLRNPATYSFRVSYSGELFPSKSVGEVRRGQRVGDYKLEAVSVETRRGPVVKDKIVRHRRRKGGVREPVWSYKRLPSRQVVVVQLSSVADGSKRTLQYPASSNDEQGKVRGEVLVGWVEIWENDEQCSNHFPVMKGSEFSWSGQSYRVDEVTPQELKLTSVNSGEQFRWPRGGAP